MVFLELLRAHQGRKAAVSLLRPFVDRTRWQVGRLAPSAWDDPYVIGFLTVVIGLAASERNGGPSNEAWGLVQSDAWAELTGVPANLVGERICLLSIGQDTAFGSGCRNGLHFFDALLRSLSHLPVHDRSGGARAARAMDQTEGSDEANISESDVAAMWDRLIGERLQLFV